MGIGSKLSQLLDANGTNANELANKIGVSPQTIYSMSKKADIDVLLKIADSFGVNAEYFVDDEDAPHTIAAHFDGSEYTEEELEKIKEYAAFIKANRK